jgi:Zn-dependent M28 family amino/carboxypeptidase
MSSAAGLRAHVEHLAGSLGERHVRRPQALDAARDYVARVWQEQGYRVERQAYLAHGIPVANLEVTLGAHEHTEGVIVVGAHYDSAPGTPGADDNASGVAALLELSRLLGGLEPRRTLRLVAFVNEEPPFFMTEQMGSAVYARRMKERGDDVYLMLSLEMLGYYRDEPGSQRYPPLFRHFYPDRGNFIGLVSNLASRRRLGELARAFREASDFPCEHAATFGWVPGIWQSDHVSFWQRGYAAAMVTDTAYYRNPHYHQASDTPDQLDYERLAAVTRGLAGALERLARSP